MRIFILGLPGVGKTTFGGLLAKHLGISHIDLDAHIENRVGCSITTYFEKHGENAFRVIESDSLIELIKDNASFVLSTGGGTPAFGSNMTIMKSSGICILLKDNRDEIAKRIIQNKEMRPMFVGLNEEEISNKLLNIWVERRPYYEQTHISTGVEAVQNPQLLTKRLELFTKTGNSLIGIIEID